MGALNNIGVASSGSYHPPATPHMTDYSYGFQLGDIILLMLCIGLLLNLIGIGLGFKWDEEKRASKTNAKTKDTSNKDKK